MAHVADHIPEWIASDGFEVGLIRTDHGSGVVWIADDPALDMAVVVFNGVGGVIKGRHVIEKFIANPTKLDFVKGED